MKRLLLIALIAIITLSGTHLGIVNAYGDSTIEGYLRDISGTGIQIEEYDGTVKYLTTDSETVFMIDQRLAQSVDFRPGMEVTATLNGTTIVSIDGFSTENTGYIQPGSKVRTGVVQKIDRDQITLKLPDGSTETYTTTAATITSRKGTNVSLNTLYVGDHVKLYFDEANTTSISRIQIEGDSVLITGIYKGKLMLADPYNNVITVQGVAEYKNGSWQTVKSSMSFSYSDEQPVYIAGQKILYRNLKYYTGKTVYMAVRSYFGNNRIEKMVFKNQYESNYSDKIDDINWYTGALELSNHKNLSFNDGTIVIKNGRLVDQYSVSAESDVFVAADGTSSGAIADVVYILNEDVNNSNIGQNYLYAGRLDEIVEGKVTLKKVYMLNDNSWESFDDSKELYYDSDTSIYDLDNQKSITPEEFYSGDYAVDESTDYASENDLEDWYAYVYTDGDRISSILVKEKLDSLSGQRITNGTIESITEDSKVGWTIQLMNAVDWSNTKEKWMQKSASVSINLEKAMIIRNGVIIDAEDLKAGDRLYIARNDYYAKVVIVK